MSKGQKLHTLKVNLSFVSYKFITIKIPQIDAII